MTAQPQQHNAGSRRPEEVGAPAQAMVAGGFVFVQRAVSSSQYPVSRNSGYSRLATGYWLPYRSANVTMMTIVTATATPLWREGSNSH